MLAALETISPARFTDVVAFTIVVHVLAKVQPGHRSNLHLHSEACSLLLRDLCGDGDCNIHLCERKVGTILLSPFSDGDFNELCRHQHRALYVLRPPGIRG